MSEVTSNSNSRTTRSTASSTATTTSITSYVGRRVSVLRGGKSIPGQIIDHDQLEDAHTVKFDADGKEEKILLSRESFQWIVQSSVPADPISSSRITRGRETHGKKKSLVGRKLEVFSSANKNGKMGTQKGEIVAYDMKTGKHEIRFDDGGKSEKLFLEEGKFRWLDTKGVIRGTEHKNICLNGSKYTGVRQTTDSSWIALGPKEKDGPCSEYIGTFEDVKDAALAHDVFARKVGRDVNLEDEAIDEDEMNRRRKKRNPPVKGKCKYRGVHWQKNRKRWMARYSHNQKGKKHVNLGAFLEAEHAAFAFDNEARKQGRDHDALNFPDMTVTEEQIKAWSTNNAHYRHMRSGTVKSSQYRGVTNPIGGTWQFDRVRPWVTQVNISKVLKGLKVNKGPYRIGKYKDERQAALAFDRVCRKYGVDETGLNFPRNVPLYDVRLFDHSCYLCHTEKPTNPVATKCNHVFCRKCIIEHLSEVEGCPCCQNPMTAQEGELRSVKLIPWPDAGSVQDPAKWDARTPSNPRKGDESKDVVSKEKEHDSDDQSAASFQDDVVGNSNSLDDGDNSIFSAEDNSVEAKKTTRVTRSSRSKRHLYGDDSDDYGGIGNAVVLSPSKESKSQPPVNGNAQQITINNDDENEPINDELMNVDGKLKSASLETVAIPKHNLMLKKKGRKRGRGNVKREEDILDAPTCGSTDILQTGEKKENKRANRGKGATIKSCQSHKKCKRDTIEAREESDDSNLIEGNDNKRENEKNQRDSDEDKETGKLRTLFVAEKERVLAMIPEEVKAQFLCCGFADWLGQYEPVLFLGPYDVSPGPVRQSWMEAFERFQMGTEQQAPRIVYWFSAERLEDAFSILVNEDWISYDEGLNKGLRGPPHRITKKQKANKELNNEEQQTVRAWRAMKLALSKPRYERAPFTKMGEDYEFAMKQSSTGKGIEVPEESSLTSEGEISKSEISKENVQNTCIECDNVGKKTRTSPRKHPLPVASKEGSKTNDSWKSKIQNDTKSSDDLEMLETAPPKSKKEASTSETTKEPVLCAVLHDLKKRTSPRAKITANITENNTKECDKSATKTSSNKPSLKRKRAIRTSVTKTQGVMRQDAEKRSSVRTKKVASDTANDIETRDKSTPSKEQNSNGNKKVPSSNKNSASSIDDETKVSSEGSEVNLSGKEQKVRSNKRTPSKSASPSNKKSSSNEGNKAKGRSKVADDDSTNKQKNASNKKSLSSSKNGKKTQTNPKTAKDDSSSTSKNEPDLSQLKVGDRMALEFDQEVYFGKIEKCHTRGKDKSKWRWTVAFDDETVYELEPVDMVDGYLLYEKIKKQELSDPRYHEKLKKFKDGYITERNRILSKIPDDIRAQFLQVGFADWLGRYQPVLFCGPYDVSPGQVRDNWMKAFKKHKATKGSQCPMIAYWLSANKLDDAFSIFTGEDWITYEEGVEKGLSNIPATISKKVSMKLKLASEEQVIYRTWTAMKEAVNKPPNERLPFPKLKEDYECVLGLGGDRLLVEVKTELRQRSRL